MTTLLVANDGGHITELRFLLPRLHLDDVVWVSVPTPQTESLLEGQPVVWAHRADTRDVKAALRNADVVRNVISAYRPQTAVSTGASLALSALPQCVARGIAAHYIESVTRTDGFSLSGRVLRRTPKLQLYTQWPHLADSRWRYRGSVLDGFSSVRSRPSPDVKSVVVSLGTSSVYGFRRLLRRVVEILPPDTHVLWQTGSTDVTGLDIDSRPYIPSRELDQAIAGCDVLIAHAGAGISLTALQAGKVPVLVPRRPEYNEHVDDHQLQIARFLAERGLAINVEVEELEFATLRRAAALAATTNEAPPPFDLAPSPVEPSR
jgi:UDP-N-acetylglucosamine--N-acetylmuramyl-(pentapeptide) pyrophosphoryl-undecaprenol N-acetylglucosamine transferase